jgi:hypothetical protein
LRRFETSQNRSRGLAIFGAVKHFSNPQIAEAGQICSLSMERFSLRDVGGMGNWASLGFNILAACCAIIVVGHVLKQGIKSTR